MSLLRIASEYDTVTGTISNRLKKAKKEFPELDWEGRTVTIDRDPLGIQKYVGMNDGKPGESVLRSGSVIRGRDLRNR